MTARNIALGSDSEDRTVRSERVSGPASQSATSEPDLLALRKRVLRARQRVLAAKALEQRCQSELDAHLSDSDVESDCSCCQSSKVSDNEQSCRRVVKTAQDYEVIFGIDPRTEKAVVLSTSVLGRKEIFHPRWEHSKAALIHLPLTVQVTTEADRSVRSLSHSMKLTSPNLNREVKRE